MVILSAIGSALLTALVWVVVALVAVFLAALTLAVNALLLLSIPLVVVLLLQAVGVLRRVPFSYNFRNLLVRWPSTLLTGLAFVLVIGLMTVMLAFVNGLYKLTQGSGQPGNVFVLADGANDELFSDLSDKAVTQLAHRDDIVRDDDGKPLVSWETYVVVNQPIPQRCSGCGKLLEIDDATHRLPKHLDPHYGESHPDEAKEIKPDDLKDDDDRLCKGCKQDFKGLRLRRFVQVRGIEDPVISGRVHNLPLHPGGQWFNEVQDLPDGSGEKGIQAVLGEGIARELGKDQNKATLGPGDVFKLGSRQWVVTGVMQSSGSTFDSEVWAKQTRVCEMFGKAGSTTVVVRTADAATAERVADDLTKNYKTPAVSAQLETAYYEKLNTTNLQFLYSVVFIVLIMGVGGVFGVMNAMFAAVSQRTKDIGVLRILGYSRWQVLTSFFLESLLLAVCGGLLGCAVGCLAHGWTATSIAGSGQGGGKSVVLKLIVDWRILGVGMGFSLMMGAVGGLLPALSAMRLKPLESLR